MDELKTWFLQPALVRLAELAALFVVVWVLVRILKAQVNRRAADSDGRYRGRKLVDIMGMALVVLCSLILFRDKLGALSVTFGLAAAGIAFALQEVIASVAGWLAVMFGGFYRTGDRVQLGGTKGDVIDIGVLRTTIMEVGQWVDGDLYNGRIVRVANSFVFKEPVFNYSSDFPFLWDEIKVPITFGSDHDQARAIMERALRDIAGELPASSKAQWRTMVNKYLIEDARTDPWVTLSFNDNWVEYTLRYVVGYKNRRGTKDALYGRLLRDVSAARDRVRFASSTIQVLPPEGSGAV
ncbi:MAG: mechanosensitive ion channel family protein [Flavobacteriales bacterium]|nr:mechanosensitive ion channel family protein [Flavobacteriales bacterium]